MKRLLSVVIFSGIALWATYLVTDHLIDANFHRRANQSAAEANAKRAQQIPLYMRGPVPELVQGGDLIHDADVAYYDIFGSTEHDVWDGINTEGPRQLNGAFAVTELQPSWIPGLPTDGVCGMRTAVVHASVTVRLPRWQAPANATDNARRAWDIELRGLARHEQQHVDIFRQGMAEITPKFQTTANCENAPQVFSALIREVNLRSLALDADRHHWTVEQEEQWAIRHEKERL